MLDANDRISAINDSVATNINNLGKIDLKKGPASSGLNILNIDGAMMAVWKRITPQIKPEISIWVFSNILKNPLKNSFMIIHFQTFQNTLTLNQICYI